jgi:hypothetical protein
MRRKWLLIALGLALAVAGLLFALFLALRPRPPAVPDAHIHPGMALADVEAIFGHAADLEAPAPIGKRTLVWLDPSGPVPVEFDGDDRVSRRGVLRPQPPTFLDQLRVRLGW